VYGSLDEALDEEKGLSAVWVAAPTPSHRDLILEAAGAGLAVGVEKPVADNADDITECYR
jgi:predicted dehydrogenase